MHFLNVDLAKGIPSLGYPKKSEEAVCACSTKYMFLKIHRKHQHRSLFSTCHLQLYCKGDTRIDIFLLILQKFLGAPLFLLWNTS